MKKDNIPETGIKIDRSSINIRENEIVEYDKEIYKIISILDFKEVVGINVKSKKVRNWKD